MKSLIKTIVIGSVLLVSIVSYSQTADDRHAKLTRYLNTVEVSSEQIKDVNGANRETNKKNVEVAGKALADSRVSYQEIVKSIPKEKSEAVKPQKAAFETQLSAAERHHKSLTDDLSKEILEEKAMKMHGSDLNTAAKQAETEHQKLKSKLGQ